MKTKSIYIFDLHNTLYDEVLEYAGAMQAALDVIIRGCNRNGYNISQNDLIKEISQHHKALGSDWDNDALSRLTCFKHIPDSDVVLTQALNIREKASRELTIKYAYSDTISIIRTLKKQNAFVYVATEATANAAADALRWLDLDEYIDAVFSWPYSKKYTKLTHAKEQYFPSISERITHATQKPDTRVLAAILLHHAQCHYDIDPCATIDDIFDFKYQNSLNLSSLLSKISDKNDHIEHIIKSIDEKMIIKDTKYIDIFKNIQNSTIYVGDSIFKDGKMAKNADIPFIYAHYGKSNSESTNVKQAKNLLYSITGWDPFLLKLTQEASAHPEITNSVQPDFTCYKSFSEFLNQ